MLSYLIFYMACLFTSFFLCIPIGPVSVEVFQKAVKKEHAQALSLAAGGAVGDAIWATTAFFGITPFLKNNGYNIHLEGIFLMITAIITFILGLIALKDARLIERFEKREEEFAKRITPRKRWAALKGLCMVLVNPLGIGSWMIALSFLKKLHIYIPLRLSFEVIFFCTVALGAFGYFTMLVVIAQRMKHLFSPEVTGKIIKIMGYLLIALSLYFLFFSLKAFFFP